ncbi:hypothetical protein TSO5_24450 [Azospirillum sp. TSO5]|nr:hypothetical protein TSO5_24450 [Azospirillum sp. TSO5]
MKLKSLAFAAFALLTLAGCTPLVVLMTPSPPPGLRSSDQSPVEVQRQEPASGGQGQAPLQQSTR